MGAGAPAGLGVEWRFAPGRFLLANATIDCKNTVTETGLFVFQGSASLHCLFVLANTPKTCINIAQKAFILFPLERINDPLEIAIILDFVGINS
ncbi:hypothetical protein [Meiothermus sp.]|uniref:hypothetical protein n=1 Tax=Meiothermus sp. TaxID=1955249 RepID=UPI002615BED4|nr:hypothetical protein [Meiothermus sp.]